MSHHLRPLGFAEPPFEVPDPPIVVDPPIAVAPPSGGGGGKGSSAFSPAVVAIIAVLGSAFLIVSYYRIFARLCTRWQNRRAAQEMMDLENQLDGGEGEPNASPLLLAHGLDEALIRKIPVFQYKRGDAFTVETECPVCLMEFLDKQDLRMLPKCAHAFHIPCIDTWLGTHSTCPLCRTNVFSEQVMSQYPNPLSPPRLNFFGTSPDGGFSPADYSMGEYGGRFNGSGRSPAPTLRGLLNFEDHEQQTRPPMVWVPPGSESGRADEPGEDSLRLYHPRDYGGDSSARHHALVIPGSGSLGSAPDPPPMEKDIVTRTASFKELQRGRSRDHDHKPWHMHPARRSARRNPNPFASVRSFSMGTSRRLANTLEFLDLEGLRSSGNGKGGDKLYNPYEYGITETPDYHARSTVLTGTLPDYPSHHAGERDRDRELEMGAGAAGGSSSELKESLRYSFDSRDNNSGGDSVGSSGAAALKVSSGRQVKGKSLSFRSPFSLKRSLSGGINMFSLRYTGKGNRVASSSDSPPPTHPPTAPPPAPDTY